MRDAWPAPLIVGPVGLRSGWDDVDREGKLDLGVQLHDGFVEADALHCDRKCHCVALELDPGAARSWHFVADVAQDQPAVVELVDWLHSAADVDAEVEGSVQRGTAALNSIMARSDALQRTGGEIGIPHQAFRRGTRRAFLGERAPPDDDLLDRLVVCVRVVMGFGGKAHRRRESRDEKA